MGFFQQVRQPRQDFKQVVHYTHKPKPLGRFQFPCSLTNSGKVTVRPPSQNREKIKSQKAFLTALFLKTVWRRSGSHTCVVSRIIVGVEEPSDRFTAGKDVVLCEEVQICLQSLLPLCNELTLHVPD